METTRPRWLVIVRFGGILLALGCVLVLVGFAVTALLNLGVIVFVAGLAVAVGGLIFRAAKGQ